MFVFAESTVLITDSLDMLAVAGLVIGLVISSIVIRGDLKYYEKLSLKRHVVVIDN